MHKGPTYDDKGPVYHALNWLVIVVVISWFVLFAIKCLETVRR